MSVLRNRFTQPLTPGSPGQEEPSPAQEAEETQRRPMGRLLPGPERVPKRERAAGCWGGCDGDCQILSAVQSL